MRRRRFLILAACCAGLCLQSCSTSQSKSAGNFRQGNYRYYWERESYAHGGGRSHRHKRVRGDVPLVMNEKVQAWLDYFTGPGRPWLDRSLQRSGRYIDMMRSALARKGLPQDLVYIALIESGFVNQARSHAAAVGTWQFIQSTGRHYGFSINQWVDERRDPEKAVEKAANFFADLYREFGDWYLAMAAYNGGPGRVRNAIAAVGSNDFWELSAPGRNVFRHETREYVPKYIAAAIIAKQPERFGFHRIRYQAPLQYDTATIHEQTDLETVAEAANVPVSTVEDLNPELRSGLTPPGRYALKLPVGSARRFAREFRQIASNRRVEVATYRARKGDTVDRVAKRYGVSTEKLLAFNHKSNGRLAKGEVLEVPVQKKRSGATIEVEVAGEEAAPIESVATTTSVASPAPESSNRGLAPVIAAIEKRDEAPVAATAEAYTVRRGDTLARIAKRTGVAVADLRRWNALETGEITIGQSLRLTAASTGESVVVAAAATADGEPAAMNESTEGTAPTGVEAPREPIKVVTAQRPLPTSYVVRSGDTLATVARRQGVTVADLRRWNQLNNGGLKIGQRLRLSPTGNAARTAAPTVASSARGATHLVRRGDTLGAIAKRYGVSLAELKTMNRLGKAGALRPGQKLVVKTGKSAPVTPATPVAATAAPRSSTVVANASWVRSPAKGRHIMHKVRRGDTIWDLAKVYKVTPHQIKQWNQLSHNTLKPGQMITIRVSS
ncbi:MAG: LysM peptidoglycan-binding domain-containing protein [Deltaproteobacteria bacterium]|nr:LysM peptidoglycan-binding domain-containing protein [Deltaproteobacteria bacterium]